MFQERINENGRKTFLYGVYHSMNDLPAFDDNNGNQEWHWRGNLHRLSGPAFIYNDGTKMWYTFGVLHRSERNENGEQLPALINSDGKLEYRINGNLKRIDNPSLPTIVQPGVYSAWHVDNVLHREENGKLLPAVVYDDGRSYYFNNGIPVIMTADGVPDEQLNALANKSKFTDEELLAICNR